MCPLWDCSFIYVWNHTHCYELHHINRVTSFPLLSVRSVTCKFWHHSHCVHVISHTMLCVMWHTCLWVTSQSFVCTNILIVCHIPSIVSDIKLNCHMISNHYYVWCHSQYYVWHHTTWLWHHSDSVFDITPTECDIAHILCVTSFQSLCVTSHPFWDITHFEQDKARLASHISQIVLSLPLCEGSHIVNFDMTSTVLYEITLMFLWSLSHFTLTYIPIVCFM